jgi:hypothetical protein
MSADRENNRFGSEEMQTTAQQDGQKRPALDDGKNRISYANVFTISGSQEEFVMRFGENRGWDSTQEELIVQLSDRLVMRPHEAKRFAALLNKGIEEYEKRYGVIENETSKSK